jgi:hypothetical protein
VRNKKVQHKEQPAGAQGSTCGCVSCHFSTVWQGSAKPTRYGWRKQPRSILVDAPATGLSLIPLRSHGSSFHESVPWTVVPRRAETSRWLWPAQHTCLSFCKDSNTLSQHPLIVPQTHRPLPLCIVKGQAVRNQYSLTVADAPACLMTCLSPKHRRRRPGSRSGATPGPVKSFCSTGNGFPLKYRIRKRRFGYGSSAVRRANLSDRRTPGSMTPNGG